MPKRPYLPPELDPAAPTRETPAAMIAPDPSARSRWPGILQGVGLGIVSAILFRLTLAPYNLAPLAFVCLVPWLWALRGKTVGEAFWISLAAGTAQSLAGLYFLLQTRLYHDMAILGLPFMYVIFGLHVAIVGALCVFFGKRFDPWTGTILSSLAWAGMEWWKGTGLFAVPISFLGHGTIEWTAFAQVASVGGVMLVSAIVFAANLSLMNVAASVVAKRGLVDSVARAVVVGVLIGGCAWWGSGVVSRTEESMAGEGSRIVRVAFIQPNVPQDQKMESYGAESREQREELQRAMVTALLRQIDGIGRGEADLIATPESSVTSDFFDMDRALQREFLSRARDLRASIMVGALDYSFRTATGEATENPAESINPDTGEPHGVDAFVALWLFRPDEKQDLLAGASYQKVQLVPFGETVPYLDAFPGFVESAIRLGTFARGRRTGPLSLPVGEASRPDSPRDEVLLGANICFEDLIPWIHRRFARAGVALFVNTTNDAWYDPWAGSLMHQSNARWRSVEMRIPMIRVTNTGVSCVVDGAGRVVEELPIREEVSRVIEVAVPVKPPVTLYARLGDWFGALSFAVAVLGWLALRIMERKIGPSRPAGA